MLEAELKVPAEHSVQALAAVLVAKEPGWHSRHALRAVAEA